jgi:dihydropteroate synthase
MSSDKAFSNQDKSLNRISLGDLLSQKRPLVMGVLNITPDSFSDGGKYFDSEKAIEHGLALSAEGADIIDIGGESTRPGAQSVDSAEEMKRVLPVIEKLANSISIPVSIDTRKADVAESACRAGATIINDISGLQNEIRIADVAKRHGAYLVLMHMRGTPENMQQGIHYNNLLDEISTFLSDAATKAITAGCPKNKIIIDPGIGFGKTVEHNFFILKKLSQLTQLGYPVMIGVSRKSFIGKSLDLPVEERLEGSLAAAVYAALHEVAILRVHDVSPTVRALRIIGLIERADR